MARLPINIQTAIDHGYYIVHASGSNVFSIYRRNELQEEVECQNHLDGIGHLIRIAEERIKNAE